MATKHTLVLILTGLSIFFAGSKQAFALRSLKFDPKAASGACIPPMSGDEAERVIRRNKVTLTGASKRQKIAFARVIKRMEDLGGGSFPIIRRAKIRILRKKGCADQGLSKPGWVTFKQGCGSLESPAYIVHELGHLVRNSGFVAAYARAVPEGNKCQFTRYSQKNYTDKRGRVIKHRYRSEEFAEVFGAFVTNPDLLLRAGRGCKRAYDFMAKKVFGRSSALACKSSGKEHYAHNHDDHDETPVRKPAKQTVTKKTVVKKVVKKKTEKVVRYAFKDCEPGVMRRPSEVTFLQSLIRGNFN